MKLIGMLDSPYVRRVAITMHRMQRPFERLDWSVGRDFTRIRAFNPLGRVPTLVLDDGEALIESAAILDYLDDLAGPSRALLPSSGPDRRQAQRLMALAAGAADKGRDTVYEQVFRPADRRHEPWLERCRTQMHGALDALEGEVAQRPPGAWLVGNTMTQADITVAVIVTFLSESAGVTPGSAPLPALRAHSARCEALPEFVATRVPFEAPRPA